MAFNYPNLKNEFDDTRNIKLIYKKIFESYGELSIAAHIERLRDLDAYLPSSSTFFCITNTKDLTFEFVSKNLKVCLGYQIEDVKVGGLKFFWSKMHPDDLDSWLMALNELMHFTMNEVSDNDRSKMSYTWNYRMLNAKNEYVNIVQNTTPLEFDDTNKPIVGMAHYTVLHPDIQLDICGTAKFLNSNDEYETRYFNNFSKKLLTFGVSNRERDIIRLLAIHHTSKEIAEKLNISPNTVDTHRRNILKKLNISSTGELIGMLRTNRHLF